MWLTGEFQLCIELAINIFGVMTAYWVDYGMSYVKNAAQFRFPLALQCVFAIATFAGIILLPESPRWLVAHDRHDEARMVLWSVEVAAKRMQLDDARVTHNLVEIQEAIQEERKAASSSSFRSLLKNGEQKFFYRTMLGIGGQFMQQLSGINLITYYAPVIFQQSVGLPHDLSLQLAGFNGIAYWLSAMVPIWLIDRLGRRKLMLFAAAGQGACMAVLAGAVSNGSASAGIVATVMLFLFNFFFSVGLLAIPWLLPAEYAPLAIRTRAAALATMSNCKFLSTVSIRGALIPGSDSAYPGIFTFLVVEITPVSISSIGYKTYIYFCIFNFAFLPLIYFFYPETRNLSLEQIDKLFTGPKIEMHWKASMDEVGGESGGHESLEKDSDGNGQTNAAHHE